MKRIYLDNAATTKIDDDVKKVMVETMEFFANPSSMYQEAFETRAMLENARKDVANILKAEKEEIIFTGSGTESDNLAIFGAVKANKEKGRHIITTKIEHPAVLRSMEQLEKEGFEVTYLDVQENGIVDVELFKKTIRDDTFFVSIMYANNEIGTIQPIQEIAEVLKEQSLRDRSKKIIFHTDACQATNYLNMNVQELGVNLMTFSGSKIYGPKGIGVLYKNKDIKIEPIIYGGGQEMNYRSGTENLFLVKGLTKALQITEKMKEKESQRLIQLRDYFIAELQKHIENIRINGDLEKRLPNNIHISVAGIEGEALLLMLNEFGILAATGSACSSKSLETSHVLDALSISDELIHGSLRFSLGRDTTKEDLDFTVQELKKIVERLRSFSVL
jgi:cysteine desulfurase